MINNEELISLNCSKGIDISVAPMLDFTTPHFRYLIRLISKHTTLYTEMLNYNTILLSDKGFERELFYNELEHPIVVQLGGSDPEKLAESAILCKKMNYDAINLNCGCPSGKVTDANFGVCLMKQPKLVRECCLAMSKASNLPITVKCRLGIEEYNEKFLDTFIEEVSADNIVNQYIMHSRIALMGIDTMKNRTIPPLMYKEVYSLKNKFPKLNFSLNGGIKTKQEILDVIRDSNNSINGIMLGRAAYDNPFLFADFDSTFYGKKDQGFNREEIVLKYSEYVDEISNRFNLNKHQLLHPLSNIFNGERYNSSFKELLFDHKALKPMKVTEMGDHIKTVLHKFKKVNPKAVNKITIYDK